MSVEQFDPNCPGCRPVCINADTGEVLPPDSPENQILIAVYDTLSLVDKLAWHKFTCQGGPEVLTPQELKAVAHFRNRIQQVMESWQ